MIACSSGCAWIGPSCVGRQQRGTVTTLEGTVAAGEIVSYQVRYETRGSQNDARFVWDGQPPATAPRIRIHATRIACTDFQAPPHVNSGACAVLASGGWSELGLPSAMIVTHGRGNPEVLGSPAEYKIWIVGDAERSARYTINITWFYGPDC